MKEDRTPREHFFDIISIFIYITITSFVITFIYNNTLIDFIESKKITYQITFGILVIIRLIRDILVK